MYSVSAIYSEIFERLNVERSNIAPIKPGKVLLFSKARMKEIEFRLLYIFSSLNMEHDLVAIDQVLFDIRQSKILGQGDALLSCENVSLSQYEQGVFVYEFELKVELKR